MVDAPCWTDPEVKLASAARSVPCQSTPEWSQKRRSSMETMAFFMSREISHSSTEVRRWSYSQAMGSPLASVMVVISGASPPMTEREDRARSSAVRAVRYPPPPAMGKIAAATMSPASITATASFIRFRPTFTRSTLVAGACHGNFRAIGLLYDGHRRPCPAVPVGRWPS